MSLMLSKGLALQPAYGTCVQAKQYLLCCVVDVLFHVLSGRPLSWFQAVYQARVRVLLL